MSKRRKALTSLILVITAMSAVAVIALHGGGVFAAEQLKSGSGNALRISPVRTDLVIEAGTSKAVDVIVQNMSGNTAKLHPIVNDFTVRQGNETGQPDIILDEGQAAPTHSLKQYVGALADFTLGPNEQKTIKVTVTIPKDAAGGGYFGAVRFEPASNAGNQVSLSGSVGSLLLVKVPGNIVEKTDLASFDVRKGDSTSSFFVSNTDLKAVSRFENKGNVQVQPFGKIILKSQSGKVLSSHEINDSEPRGNVLPNSIRRFDTALTKVGSFGKFTVEANFGYGSSGQLLVAKKTFYVVPVWVMALAGGVVLVIILGIFVIPRAIRTYNQSIIRKATSRRR